MDNFLIDTQKLSYHPARVNEWFQGKEIFPLYVEIAPVYGCNQQCIFCAFDYLGKKPYFLEQKIMAKEFPKMFNKGVRSVLFAGEGEPLVHPRISSLIRDSKKAGLDVALSTNGVLLDDEKIDCCLNYLTWLRLSINAATARTYARIHGCPEKDFDRVMDNITKIVRVRKKNKSSCTLGVQFVLLEHNFNETIFLVERLKDTGIDYVVIKPYSRHLLSKHSIALVSLERSSALFAKIKKFESKDFQVIFRLNAMRTLGSKKFYSKCFGTSFWSYIDAQANVYACSSFLGDEKFCYGNIYDKGFLGVWKSQKRKKVLKFINKDLDISKCRKACRMDEVNKYLWELKNPQAHVNFI